MKVDLEDIHPGQKTDGRIQCAEQGCPSSIPIVPDLDLTAQGWEIADHLWFCKDCSVEIIRLRHI